MHYMRVKLSGVCGQALLLFLVFSACRRSQEEAPVVPPVTHPLSREFIGYGVVNVSFVHLLNEPGPGGVSGAYLRRGTMVRVIERRSVINRGTPELWVLAEGNYQNSTVSSQGWLPELNLEIYENESRAKTASDAMNQ
jgi:hypothetical protein